MTSNIDLEHSKKEIISELLELFGDFFYVEPSERFIYEYGVEETDYIEFTDYLLEINNTMDDYEYGKLYIVSLAYTQVKLGIDYKEFRDKAFSIFNNLLESGLKELMELDKVKEIKKALSKKKIPKFNLKKSVLSTIKIGNIYAFKMYPKEYNKVTPNHYLFDKYVIFKVIAFSLSKEPVIVMYNKFYDSIPSFDDVKENDDILLHNVIYRKKPYGPFYTIYGIAPEMVCITGYEESFWLDELLLIGNHPANEKYNELYKTENSYWKVHRDPNIYWIRNDGFGKVYILCFEEAKLKGNLDLENSRIQETISEELKRFNDGIYLDYLDILNSEN